VVVVDDGTVVVGSVVVVVDNGVPTHNPLTQISFTVPGFPSLQGKLLLVYTQPMAGLHESSVHMFASLQTREMPAWHVPPLQVSFCVQAFPSLQDEVLFV
jgi:hypothetical protein